MVTQKTRCRQCIHAAMNATADPCNRCSEIQCNPKKYENHFEPAAEEEVSKVDCCSNGQQAKGFNAEKVKEYFESRGVKVSTV